MVVSVDILARMMRNPNTACRRRILFVSRRHATYHTRQQRTLTAPKGRDRTRTVGRIIRAVARALAAPTPPLPLSHTTTTIHQRTRTCTRCAVHRWDTRPRTWRTDAVGLRVGQWRRRERRARWDVRTRLTRTPRPAHRRRRQPHRCRRRRTPHPTPSTILLPRQTRTRAPLPLRIIRTPQPRRAILSPQPRPIRALGLRFTIPLRRTHRCESRCVGSGMRWWAKLRLRRGRRDRQIASPLRNRRPIVALRDRKSVV